MCALQFGQHVFQCVVEGAGVGYRRSPKFADKVRSWQQRARWLIRVWMRRMQMCLDQLRLQWWLQMGLCRVRMQDASECWTAADVSDCRAGGIVLEV